MYIHSYSQQRKTNVELLTKHFQNKPKADSRLDTLHTLKFILNKNAQNRVKAQNKILDSFIKNSPFFTSLTEASSFQVAKNIMKNAHIHEIIKNRIIIKQGANIENIIVLLSGKFGIVEANIESSKHNAHNANQSQKIDSQVYKKIVQNSINIVRNLRRKIKQVLIDPFAVVEYKTSKAEMSQIKFKKFIENQEQVFNLSVLLHCNKYKETLITCDSSMIMVINAKLFYQNLATFLKSAKAQKIKYFRKFTAFDEIQDDKLVHFVDQLPIKKMRKGQIIYQQGKQITDIFLLVDGNIKITKCVDLFKENPNLFYMNRESLCPGSKLSYANFTQVYNYKATKKSLQIGIVNQISIFGQQQMCSQQSMRQTTAQVNSENATLYLISIQKLQNDFVHIKNFQHNFKNTLLDAQTKQKIIYRQQKLAELLMLENKKNMNYFFVEQNVNAGLSRPRSAVSKDKINKINLLISQNVHNKSKKQSSVNDAFYNTFNFNKFPFSLPFRRKRKSKNAEPQSFTTEQAKVIELIHFYEPTNLNSNNVNVTEENNIDTDEIKKKQKFSHHRQYSQQINKFVIDIANPLFEINRFKPKTKQFLKANKSSRVRPATATSQKSRSRPKSATSARVMATSSLF